MTVYDDLLKTNPLLAAVYKKVETAYLASAQANSQLETALTALGIYGTTPTPAPTPTPTPQGVTLHPPTVTGSGAAYSVTSDVVAGDNPVTFKYLQIAVRGPDGQVADTGHVTNVSLAAKETKKLSGSFAPTVSGQWRTYATYNITGGTQQSDWVDGPSTYTSVTLPTPAPTPAPTPTPVSGKIPKVGFSGLPWNSGGFVQDSWNPAAVNAFGSYRGTPVDTMLVFSARKTWDEVHTWYDPWGTWPGILILSLPPQPEGQNNSATAAGTNNQRWKDYGSKLAVKGQNKPSTVIRLGWECNGNWYDWSAHKNGRWATFIAAFKNVVTSVRATAPNISFNLCLNKDWEHSSMPWRTVLDQLAGYVDVVGLDAYDSWTGWRNDTGKMNAWYAKSGPQRNSVAEYCRAKGLLMSLDEWGLCAAASNDGTGGGDDQLYITNTWDWCNANKDILAWESYFNVAGAPSDQFHTLSNYPNSLSAYRSTSRWGGGK